MSAAEVATLAGVTSLAAAISTDPLMETRLAIHTARPGFLKEKPDLGTGRAQLDGPTVLGTLADDFKTSLGSWWFQQTGAGPKPTL